MVLVPLPEGQADDVYQQTVRALNTHFHVQKNAAYERHVLRHLHQEPGEDVDSFVLRLRKQARHCGYGDERLEIAVRDPLLEKVSSQELRTKLFEVPNIQRAAALTTARAWQTARGQANVIAGGEGKSSVNLVQHRESKGISEGQATHKCYACGRPGHFVRDKVCPARGKACAKCGRKGHWAICCRHEADGKQSKTGGRASGSNSHRESSVRCKPPLRPRKQINQVEYDSGDEPFAFPVNFRGETACEDNIVAVKINGTATNKMIVDSGAQFTVLDERRFHSLVRSGLKAKLQPEERNLRVYGNGCLPVVGKFEATIEFHGQTVAETVLVRQGEGRCPLGSSAAKCLQVLKVRPEIARAATVYSVDSDIESIPDRFPKVFSGVGKLSGYQLKLHIYRKVTPVAQKPRQVPYPLKIKSSRRLESYLILTSSRKCQAQQPGSALLYLFRSQRKMKCGYALI